MARYQTAIDASSRSRRVNIKFSNLVITILVLSLAPSSGHAQSDLDDRFSISLGAFFTDWGTRAQLDSDTLGAGTDIDFEDDLGLKSSLSTFRLDGHYRFNQKHRINFSVFNMSRDASRTIDQDIQYGDITFVLNAQLKASTDLSIYKLAYTYSFLWREKGFLGASIGLYIADSKIRLAEQNLGQIEQGEITAPLPVIGLRGNYRLSDRFTFRGSGEIFALEYDNVDGALTDFYVGIDYRMSQHTALGLGYNKVSIDVDAKRENFTGTLDWAYDGALLYFKLNF